MCEYWHVTFDVAELSRSEEFCWCICHHGWSHAVISRGSGVRLAGMHTQTHCYTTIHHSPPLAGNWPSSDHLPRAPGPGFTRRRSPSIPTGRQADTPISSCPRPW